jgi:hypothetical protein
MPASSRARHALVPILLASAGLALAAWGGLAARDGADEPRRDGVEALDGRAAAPPVPLAAAVDGDPPPCALGASACAGPEGHAAVRAEAAGDERRAVAPGAGVRLPATGAPQLLEFEAAYCAACATMAPVVSSIVTSCAKASEVVRRVDVAGDEGEALAQHYRIDALPTFLAVDADGHEVFRRIGVQKPAELASIVAEVSGEGCSVAN